MPTIDPNTKIEVWEINYYLSSPTGSKGAKTLISTRLASELIGNVPVPVKFPTSLGPDDVVVACFTQFSFKPETSKLLSKSEFDLLTAGIPEISEADYQSWLNTVEDEMLSLFI